MVCGSTPAEGTIFLFFFGRFAFVFLVQFSFFFFLAYFQFLTDLNNTGRLIASSLSAFIFKTINPQVSHRHPLIYIKQCVFSVGHIVAI